jgi:hypothetical protein
MPPRTLRIAKEYIARKASRLSKASPEDIAVLNRFFHSDVEYNGMCAKFTVECARIELRTASPHVEQALEKAWQYSQYSVDDIIDCVFELCGANVIVAPQSKKQLSQYAESTVHAIIAL